MELRLYDTLTKEKRPFVPLDPNNVRMYVCGPTVYDFAHIGNARPVIVFDVLFRLLQYLAQQGVWDSGKGETKVTYVRNITDVDDKINARAAERIAARGETNADLNAEIRAVTEETYRDFKGDVEALRCLPPTFEPRATEYVLRDDGKDMITLIEKLIKSGNAYEAEGHVLFNVPSMPDYGKLSRRSLDEMEAGARVEVAPYKRDPMDFVLWKPSEPAEPGWVSPWGRGRPGWHIECSAMAWKHLGEQFDIHGGGIDLVFPHHENELAQSRCAFHTNTMANFWMHNGFLQVEGEKMSKSTGNFVTIRELLESDKFGGQEWSGEVLRLAMLQTHYRQPIDWTVNNLQQSEKRLQGWKNFAADRTRSQLNKSLFEDVIEALCDDLNFPNAFAIIDRAVNSDQANTRDRYTVYKILRTLGFRGGQSNVAKLSKQLSLVLEKFSKFSESDWKNIAAGVERKPVLSSGNFKSGTLLLAHIAVTQQLLKKVLPSIESALSSKVVEDLHQVFLGNLIPRPRRISSKAKRKNKIEELIQSRIAARARKDFTESDRLRNELAELGVLVKDVKDPVTGESKMTWEDSR
jgi:cysteinyl-tRNA synthetase